jgi:hypothetical protein
MGVGCASKPSPREFAVGSTRLRRRRRGLASRSLWDLSAACGRFPAGASGAEAFGVEVRVGRHDVVDYDVVATGTRGTTST